MKPLGIDTKEDQSHLAGRVHNEGILLSPGDMLPDASYFVKVVRRQAVRATLAALLVLVVGIPAARFIDNEYLSSISAISDKRDSSRMLRNFSDGSQSDPVLVSFDTYIKSTEFLKKIVRDLDLVESSAGDSDKPSTLKSIKTVIKNFLRLPGTDGQEKERGADKQLQGAIESLRKKLRTINDPYAGTFTLHVTADEPKKAHDIATTVMEQYIQNELKAELERIKTKHEFLSAEFKEAQSLLRSSTRSGRANTVTNTESDASRKHLVVLSDEQERLQQEVAQLENEFNRAREDRMRERMRLENELNTLRTRLQPDHPAVKAAKKQLNEYSGDPGRDSALEGRIDAAKRRLAEVKMQVLSSPANARREVATGFNFEDTVLEDRVASLAMRVEDLAVERANLEQQVSIPALRNRLKVISPASFETKPSSNKKLKILIGSGVLSVFAACFVAFMSEIRCGLARDAWRVVRRVSKPVITQISRRSMLLYPRISPELADKLRASLGTKDATPLGSKTLLAYRRLELAVERHCRGRIVFLGSVGPQEHVGDILYNFLNLFSTDTSNHCILVDCNHLDPVIVLPAEGTDLGSLLKDSEEGKELVVCKPRGVSFSMVPPISKMAGEKTRVFQRNALQNFLEELATRFDVVFVRGLPDTHFMENAAVLDACTDGILCYDTSKTTFQQIERNLAHLSADKIRGLVLLGT